MHQQKSKEHSSAVSKTSHSTERTAHNTTNLPKWIVQNYTLIWMDANIHKSNTDTQNTLAQLRAVVNHVNIFTEPQQCIQFLNDINHEKVFVITSGSLGQYLVPVIHGMSKLDSIYIFCSNKTHHKQWVKQWNKIKGIHTSIKHICEALQMAVKQCEQDFIPVSFVEKNNTTSSEDLNHLEPSYMYTQIFKDILLEMEYGQQSIKDLAKYCRKFYDGNMVELDKIDEFKRKYDPKWAIWWYTRDCFTHQMLNRALRTLEVDTILKMGFFIRDLHQQIKLLHQQQAGAYQGKPITVYRGQGLSTKDFEKLRKTKHGLMSFNNFLSTSTKREVSLGFANDPLTKTDMVGILFQMFVDPSVSSASFAAVKENSYFNTEEEILFSMHTVFRIGEINQKDKNKSLYQVELTLTSDDDQQLRTLTKHIQESVRGTGWERMGNLLLYLKKLDKAEELFTSLLEQTSDESKKAHYYNSLGYVKNNQGDYSKAIEYYESGLKIDHKTLSENHPDLATSYNNIAGVYKNMGEYLNALWYYEKALDIDKKTLSENHPDLATSYNNIGLMYKNMGEYSKALWYYEKDLQICKRTLPLNHPDLGTSYKNNAELYESMGNYSKAYSLYKKARSIKQHSLLPDDPSLKDVQERIEFVKKKL